MTEKPEMSAGSVGASPAGAPAGAPDDEPRTMKTMLRSLWRGWIKPIGLVVLVLTCARSTVADWNDVPSQSMEPTILVGDRIFVNRLAYGLKVPFTTWHLATWSEPRRGEIIVFYAPKNGKRMVKRVVGVPGDRVSMRNNHLIINGEPVLSRPIDGSTVDVPDLSDPMPLDFRLENFGPDVHMTMFQPGRVAKRTFREIVVPDGRYFVMGDNRDNSGDSREFGLVPREQILGRAVAVAISLDRRNSYAPRWERFFHGIE
ncbi:MAG: signal peptidase I [Phycisphaerales bacterium]|nr:signal peptidase I [Phycisphaerales bacterium]